MTKIQWTERTWNPVRGCVKISPGCKHCYAETFAERFRGVPGHPYEQGFDLRLVPEKLREPLRWKAPQMVFVNSMSDLFQVSVPFEFVDQVFAVMALTPQHTYQVLTKSPERMRSFLTEREMRIREATADYLSLAGYPRDAITFPLPNVWPGVSVESKKYLDRLDLLRETPAAVRLVSFEPLLEDLGTVNLQGIGWAIVGGESGPRARPFELEWAEALREQCQQAETAFFMKQVGASPRWQGFELGRARKGDRKGGDMQDWPVSLRVREFPKARPA